MDTQTEDIPVFQANVDLLRASPAGMVQCAADWLAASKGRYGFDQEHTGFKAAGHLFSSAPDIFVGAGGDPWVESQRPRFWALFFEARASGAAVADFKAAISALGKPVLGIGAKDMLISAARCKDVESFGELLDMGAARRSKLVMFSAYQNGGKRVALQVKAPTANEAHEMLLNGAELGAWRSSRAMKHDAEGFLWLMGLSGQQIKASAVARIGANAEDPSLLELAVSKHIDDMTFESEREYFHQIGEYVERDMKGVCAAAILAMASAGSPKAAKALAVAKGGVELWKEACFKGFAGIFNLPVRGAGSAHANVVDLPVGASEEKKDMNLQPKTAPQHAVSISRHAEASEWLRAEYEAIGAPWLPPQELVKAFKGVQSTRNYGVDGPRLVQEAVSLSEAIDLRGGLDKGKLDPKRKKTRSL
jgi:hypothetical protein